MARSSRATFFAESRAFRSWLEKNHRTASELLVGFHKRGSRIPSITWPEAVDQALCYGWIDGIRKRIDDQRYSIRFTPRRPSSTWSSVNINRVAALKAEGLMQPAGLEAFGRRSEKRSGVYSYERQKTLTFSEADVKKLQANRKAWTFLQAQPPSYRHLVTYWISSAKKPETHENRLVKLIDASAAGRRL
jgi:uncharacterized protein YdeI (YjbR/CyaY-like superfamily)